MSDDFEQLAQAAFADESAQMLEQFEAAVLQLRAQSHNGGLVREAADAAFRAVHTIKGSAGIFEMEPLVRLAHRAESLLAEIRDRGLVASAVAESTLLRAHDLMSQLCTAESDAATTAVDVLVADIDALLATRPDPNGAATVQVLSWRPQGDVHSTTALESWLAAINQLQAVGELIAVPSAVGLDNPPHPWWNGFDAVLQPHFAPHFAPHVGPQAVDQALSALRPLGDLRSLPIDAGAQDWQALLEDRASSAQERTALLQRWDTLGLNASTRWGAHKPAGPPQPAPEPRPLPAQAAAPSVAGPKVRVGAAKVDSLIDSLSAAASSMALSHQAALRSSNAGVAVSTEQAQQAVKQARLDALELRMTSVAEVFGRFPRLVRDVSQALGKDVELILDDGDAEIDRAIVEAVVDPLTHLIRNSLDHGIEAAAERVRAGKPAKGHLALSARRESGHVVLELRDDGRGLNQERIRARAAERGLAAADAHLTDADLLRLICSPGFSTASQVTDLSGRGVGMDVVKRNIEALHGHLTMSSVAGRGTAFQMRVPMTLALLAGLVVMVGPQPYVLPLDVVTACAEVPAVHNSTTGTVQVEGQFVACVDLRRLFDAPAPSGRRQRAARVLARTPGGPLALIVDSIAGEQQVVIRSLGPAMARLALFNGAAILDNGAVGHIFDVAALQTLLSADTSARRQAA